MRKTFVAMFAMAGLLGCSRPPLWLLPSERPPRFDGGADAPAANPDGPTTNPDAPAANPDAGVDVRPVVVTPATAVVTWKGGNNRKMDLLFVIDDAPGMEAAQENLRANLPRFIDVLKGLPEGLPDLHIAVISADLGAGDGDVPGCSAKGGDRGVFQFQAARGSGCGATGLEPGAHFVSSTGGQVPRTNFGDNDITAVVQCLLPIGGRGCMFGRPLAAAARALGADGAPAPPENAGFLRGDARLSIVLLTNRDDCSAADERFYTRADNAIATTLGPATRYRCNEFGHRCATTSAVPLAPPLRKAPFSMVGDVVNYASCVPAEASGRLTPVAELAAGIKRLKVDPDDAIMVASTHGPSVPYAVHWVQPAIAGEPPWPEVSHSCTGADGAPADPGVRMQAFAEQFANGFVSSPCAANFGPVLNRIATKLSALGPYGCLAGRPWDTDGKPGNGIQLDCAVVDRLPGGPGGTPVETSLPACSIAPQAVPCWNAHPGPMLPPDCPEGAIALSVRRADVNVSDQLQSEARCKVCPPGQSDPAHGCP